jgi:hypothetical protein
MVHAHFLKEEGKELAFAKGIGICGNYESRKGAEDGEDGTDGKEGHSGEEGEERAFRGRKEAKHKLISITMGQGKCEQNSPKKFGQRSLANGIKCQQDKVPKGEKCQQDKVPNGIKCQRGAKCQTGCKMPKKIDQRSAELMAKN